MSFESVKPIIASVTLTGWIYLLPRRIFLSLFKGVRLHIVLVAFSTVAAFKLPFIFGIPLSYLNRGSFAALRPFSGVFISWTIVETLADGLRGKQHELVASVDTVA